MIQDCIKESKKEENYKFILISETQIDGIITDTQNYNKESDYFIFQNYPFFNKKYKDMLKDILSTFNYIIFYNTNADSDLDFWKKLRSFSPQEFVEGWINKFIERVDGVKRKGDILLLGASNKIFDKIDQNENYKHKICKYRMYQTPNISEFLEKEMLINFKKKWKRKSYSIS